MAGEMKYTPTPWINQGIYDEADPSERGADFIVGLERGGLIAAALPWPTELDSGDFSRVTANAEFIVMAVNVHYELAAALREARVALNSVHETDGLLDHEKPALAAIDAVLAKLSA